MEMENKTPSQECQLPTLQKIGNTTIGFNRYQFLKGLSFEDLTEEEIAQIKTYEELHQPTAEQIENRKKFVREIMTPKSEKENEFKITAMQLFKLFKEKFLEVNGRPLIKIEGVTIKNLEPLIYYFSKDERFFECENLSKLSEPSFEKGLLVIGNFGNGKTSTMITFEKIFQNIKGISFKGYTANEVVGMFEKCGDDISKKEFERKVNFGTRYFDDVKTERVASNFGKVNLFKDILESRYNNKVKTHITCNFKENFEGNIEMALEEFGENYGGRVHDRLFAMFNIIEFKGKSFRK
jgi:DNA replication protein DnaC